MKADNIILLAVGAVIALMGWAALAPDTTAATGSLSSPDLRTAIATGQPVLVDFYADWCGPCQAMKPVVHELANDLRGKLQTVQINVDQQGALAQQYGVRGIPCFVVLKGGKEVARQVGSVPKATLRQLTGL